MLEKWHPGSCASLFQARFIFLRAFSLESDWLIADKIDEGNIPLVGTSTWNSVPFKLKRAWRSHDWTIFCNSSNKSLDAAYLYLAGLLAAVTWEHNAAKSIDVGIVFSTKNWFVTPGFSSFLFFTAEDSSKVGTSEVGHRSLCCLFQESTLEDFHFPEMV